MVGKYLGSKIFLEYYFYNKKYKNLYTCMMTDVESACELLLYSANCLDHFCSHHEISTPNLKSHRWCIMCDKLYHLKQSWSKIFNGFSRVFNSLLRAFLNFAEKHMRSDQITSTEVWQMKMNSIWIPSGICWYAKLCAHGRRFRAFSKTFSSLLSFWRPVYMDQGKIFSMYWISSNFSGTAELPWLGGLCVKTINF